MAVTKLTRSPRRAQLPALPRKRRRLPKPVERLPLYENLHALNRDFEQVLADLARLQELGVFRRGLGNILRVVVQQTRAWANMNLAELLQMREQDDRAYFGRLHDRWEKKLKDPNDVLIEAARLMEKRRRAAARRKPSESGADPDRRPYDRELQLPPWLRRRTLHHRRLDALPKSGRPPAGQDQWVVQESTPPGQTLEAEDEFERARR